MWKLAKSLTEPSRLFNLQVSSLGDSQCFWGICITFYGICMIFIFSTNSNIQRPFFSLLGPFFLLYSTAPLLLCFTYHLCRFFFLLCFTYHFTIKIKVGCFFHNNLGQKRREAISSIILQSLQSWLGQKAGQRGHI